MAQQQKTTAEKIAEIANGFGQGVQNFYQVQNQKRTQGLQEEALRRQQALQSLDASNNIAASTGKYIDPGQVAPMLKSGNFQDMGPLLQSAPSTRKAELEQKTLERENLKAQREDEKYRLEKEELAKPFEQTRDYQKIKATAGLRASAKANAGGVDKVTQKQMEKLGTGNAGLFNVKTAMDEALLILKDKSVSEDQKIKTGQSLFKLLNSAEGSDAVGAEEAKRIGSYLEYNVGNFTQPGAFIGRDVGGFTNQVTNYSNLLGQRIARNEQGISALRGGGTLSGSNAAPVKKEAPVKITQQHVNTVKSMSDEDLLKFVQGG